jgi:threonine/homoserine/homoserine lactone efflux protein
LAARQQACFAHAQHAPAGDEPPPVTYIPNPLIIPVGIAMGILLAMPFGPINLLGLQRAVERGFFGGMAAAIGIMSADGLIALGAALGVNAISGAIREYRTAIQIIGGAALLAFGIKLCLTKATIVADTHAGKASIWDYIWDIPQMFFLTLTNPGALLGLIAIFGGVSSFVEVESYIDAFTMVAAILGGSFLYWFVVSQFIAAIRHRFDVVRLEQINRVAGLILIGFGCVLIGEMVVKRLRFW